MSDIYLYCKLLLQIAHLLEVSFKRLRHVLQYLWPHCDQSKSTDPISFKQIGQDIVVFIYRNLWVHFSHVLVFQWFSLYTFESNEPLNHALLRELCRTLPTRNSVAAQLVSFFAWDVPFYIFCSSLNTLLWAFSCINNNRMRRKNLVILGEKI